MNRNWQDGEDLNPEDLPDKALECAVLACGQSQWASDREFAQACSDELDRRMALARGRRRSEV